MYSVVHLPSLVIFGAIEMTVIITVSLDVHWLEYLKLTLPDSKVGCCHEGQLTGVHRVVGPWKTLQAWIEKQIQSNGVINTYGHKHVVMYTHMHVHTRVHSYLHTETTTKGKTYTEWCSLNFATHKTNVSFNIIWDNHFNCVRNLISASTTTQTVFVQMTSMQQNPRGWHEREVMGWCWGAVPVLFALSAICVGNIVTSNYETMCRELAGKRGP